MIYAAGRALTDPRSYRVGMRGLRGIGQGLLDPTALINAGAQVGEHLLENVGAGIMHFLGGGDDAPAPRPPPPPPAPVWPWVVGGTLLAGAIGYGIYRSSKRRR